MELLKKHSSMERKKSIRLNKLPLNYFQQQKLNWEINFEKTQELQLINPETQSKLYQKIRSFILLKNQKKMKQSQSVQSHQQKQKCVCLNSKKQISKRKQQNQQINLSKPKLLPPVSYSLENKKRKKKAVRSLSVIDNILTSKKSFMKTYFKDLKTHFNSTKSQYIEQLFADITMGQWKICGYLKGEFLLIKGVNKKGKSIIKKYKYENVRIELRQNMRQWLHNHFILYTESIA